MSGPDSGRRKGVGEKGKRGTLVGLECVHRKIGIPNAHPAGPCASARPTFGPIFDSAGKPGRRYRLVPIGEWKLGRAERGNIGAFREIREVGVALHLRFWTVIWLI